jgi:hypothetical protein
MMLCGVSINMILCGVSVVVQTNKVVYECQQWKSRGQATNLGSCDSEHSYGDRKSPCEQAQRRQTMLRRVLLM